MDKENMAREIEKLNFTLNKERLSNLTSLRNNIVSLIDTMANVVYALDKNNIDECDILRQAADNVTRVYSNTYKKAVGI